MQDRVASQACFRKGCQNVSKGNSLPEQAATRVSGFPSIEQCWCWRSKGRLETARFDVECCDEACNVVMCNVQCTLQPVRWCSVVASTGCVQVTASARARLDVRCRA